MALAPKSPQRSLKFLPRIKCKAAPLPTLAPASVFSTEAKCCWLAPSLQHCLHPGIKVIGRNPANVSQCSTLWADIYLKLQGAAIAPPRANQQFIAEMKWTMTHYGDKKCVKNNFTAVRIMAAEIRSRIQSLFTAAPGRVFGPCRAPTCSSAESRFCQNTPILK